MSVWVGEHANVLEPARLESEQAEGLRSPGRLGAGLTPTVSYSAPCGHSGALFLETCACAVSLRHVVYQL